MLFEIDRVSRPYKNVPPCDGAVLKRERLEDGREWKSWVIEIPDLDALMELQKRVGCDLIVGDGRIRIYDDYVE